MNSRIVALLGTGTNAVYSLLPQFTAMFMLVPEQFGKFSLVYLAYALFGSVCMSAVSEPWVLDIRDRNLNTASTGTAYGRVLGTLSSVAGLVGTVIASLTFGLDVYAIILGTSVALSVLRMGTRYREIVDRRFVRASLADCAGISVFTIALLIGSQANVAELGIVAIAWVSAGLSAMVVGGGVAFAGARAIRFWWYEHRNRSVGLLRDSALGDTSAIGVPYLVAAILTPSGFGIYRAVSNVSAPVRLLLAPMRPALGSIAPARLRGLPLLLLVGVSSGVLGVSTWLILDGVASRGILGAVLLGLSEFAVPVAVFVVANSVVHFYSMVGRLCLDSTWLLIARIGQVAFSVSGPVLGAFHSSLSGAIAGLAICTVCGAVLWVACVLGFGNRDVDVGV